MMTAGMAALRDGTRRARAAHPEATLLASCLLPRRLLAGGGWHVSHETLHVTADLDDALDDALAAILAVESHHP